jgi:TrmH family RNA methyltransferase
MAVRTIESKQNPRLKELRKAIAAPGSHPRGMAGIEGPNLVEEALRAGLAIECVFVAAGSEALLEGLPLAAETEVLLLPRALLASALATEAPQPIAALVAPPAWTWKDLLQNQQETLLVVLAGLQDPGNVGTILRSAEAFGATGVVTLPGTVSAWNPKAVRASAGSVFRLPLLAATPEDCFTRLRRAKVTVWTTAVRDAQPAPAAALDKPAALVIGNEGNGVPAQIAALIVAHGGTTLTIPCPGPVESLNAAVAASILLYEASRQRTTARPAQTRTAQEGAAR